MSVVVMTIVMTEVVNTFNPIYLTVDENRMEFSEQVVLEAHQQIFIATEYYMLYSGRNKYLGSVWGLCLWLIL